MKHQTTILVAALNWGLGHATRCIPIIQELIEQQVNVILASDGDAMRVFQKAYPDLITLELPSYDIRYKSNNMFLNIAPQVPHILKTIKLEREKISHIIQTYKIDAVISDNRYGLYHPSIPCIFITHQIRIKMPFKWLENLVEKEHARYINVFDKCWIPDYEGSDNLSGSLSHSPTSLDIQYIGPLSRMKAPIKQVDNTTYDICIVLSGPDPQRSYLEQEVLDQTKQGTLKTLIIGGKPDGHGIQTSKQQEYIPFLSHLELEKKLSQSNLVVCRSGYSTLMDLMALQCSNVLLIPTPGQTEQEYLAQHFAKKYNYQVQQQKELDLQKAWQNVKKNNPQPYFNTSKQTLNKTIADFLRSLASCK